tara:strand:- start:9378 stop:9563 length:186 start_codon:yes stop_codon:yes gene_type:complete
MLLVTSLKRPADSVARDTRLSQNEREKLISESHRAAQNQLHLAILIALGAGMCQRAVLKLK